MDYPMDLPFEDLLYFVTFARSANSIEAARKLGVSQPTLTERLKALESRLPTSPFAWAGKKKILNPYGHQLLAVVEPRLLDLQHSVRELIHSKTSPENREVGIAGRMEIVARLTENVRFPGKLIYTPCRSSEAVQRILQGRTDIAITREPPLASDLVAQKLFISRPCLVLRKNMNAVNWKKNQPSTNPSDWAPLFKLPYVSYGTNTLWLEQLLSWCRFPAESVKTSVVCENWLLIKDLILREPSFTLMPSELVEGDGRFVAHSLEVFENLKTQWYILYRRSFTRTEEGKKLIESVRRCWS